MDRTLQRSCIPQLCMPAWSSCGWRFPCSVSGRAWFCLCVLFICVRCEKRMARGEERKVESCNWKVERRTRTFNCVMNGLKKKKRKNKKTMQMTKAEHDMNRERLAAQLLSMFSNFLLG